MEAGREHGVHRLPGLGERDGNVEEELARRRVGDDGSLVAHDEIVETRLLEVRAHRYEHPPGDDHDVRAGCPRPRERLPGARVKDSVLGDQRPVEVEREGGDVPRESLRECELYGAWPPVESTT